MNKLMRLNTLFCGLLLLVFFIGCNIEDYDVNYYDDGKLINLEHVKSGDALLDNYTPKKDGNTFVGWYTTSNFIEPYDFSLPLGDDINLYAKWKANIYSINYVGFNNELLYSESVEFGSDLTDIEMPQASEVPGYSFEGWNDVLPSVMPAKDLTLKQQYELILVTIEFLNSRQESVDFLVQDDYDSFFEGDSVFMVVEHFIYMTEDDKTKMLEEGIINQDTNEYLIDIAFYSVLNPTIIPKLKVDESLLTISTADPQVFINIENSTISEIYAIIDILMESEMKLHITLRYNPED